MAKLTAVRSEDQSAEAEIASIVNERAHAIHSGDVERMLSFYDPEVVIFSLAPPLRFHGPDRAATQKWLESYENPITWESRDLKINCDDRIGFCHNLARVTGTLRGGKKVDMWFRLTLCLKKKDGRWLITHEHQSEPFDMQTLQAQLSLKP